MESTIVSENSPNIKEEIENDYYLDDKIFVTETTINIKTTELNECGRDDKIKLDLMSINNSILDDEIKVKYDVADTKVEFNNKQLFCNNCNEYYKEYCTKCGMLIHILNGNNLNIRAIKELPADMLEIKEGLFEDTGIFAVKTIPKGVKFGPFTGFCLPEWFCKLKGGKFVVRDEFLNWMQYVNSTSSVSEQNLYAFRDDGNLYYRSICEIQKGEELLLYFGEEYEENLSDDVEMDFIPVIEKDVQNVFACTFCCLGFSLKEYLVDHKTICSNGINEYSEEFIQCPFCKIYLEKKEYLEYHRIYCCKENTRSDDYTLKVPPAMDNRKRPLPKTFESNRKNDTNEHYELKIFRCKICYKGFNKRESLKLHVENVHVSIKRKRKQKYSVSRFWQVNSNDIKEKTSSSHRREKYCNCKECAYSANCKSHLIRHIKAAIIKDGDYYKCMKCHYRTNRRSSLITHIKTQHLQVCDYKCLECEYETNYKPLLKAHLETKHLKQRDYKWGLDYEICYKQYL